MVVTMPLPTTRVIPEQWATHHRPITEAAMSATIRITTSTSGDWDPNTPPTTGATTVLYEGRARIQAQATQPAQRDAAGQFVTQHTYLVAITADSPVVPVGDQGAKVHVLTVDPNGDASLVGRRMTVADARYSSLRWERDLTCTDDHHNQTGGDPQ